MLPAILQLYCQILVNKNDISYQCFAAETINYTLTQVNKKLPFTAHIINYLLISFTIYCINNIQVKNNPF